MDIQPVVVDRGLLRARSDSGETWEDGGGVGLVGGVVGDLDGGMVGDLGGGVGDLMGPGLW